MSQPPGPPGPPYPPPPGVPAYAYGGPPPLPDPRPGPVTAAGVVTIVLGVLGILAGLGLGVLIALLGVFVGELSEGKAPGEGEGVATGFAVAAVLVALVVVSLSVAYLLLGVRVLRRGPVARALLTAWNALGVLGGVLSVGSGVLGLALDSGPLGGGTVLSAVLLVPTVAVLVCLWTPESRAWFDRRPTP